MHVAYASITNPQKLVHNCADAAAGAVRLALEKPEAF